MSEFLLLMHNDAPDERSADWSVYLDRLAASGRLRGGSSLGSGICARKDGGARPVSAHISGFVRIVADSLEEARTCLEGNPVYEGGGTVEIRLLVADE